MEKRDAGFTLAEVLAALVILGIVITLAAQTMTWHGRLSKLGYEEVETEQALRSAMELIDREVRQAKLVSIPQQGKLLVTRTNNQQILFYVADKDANGINDIYLETDGHPNPVASYIQAVKFVAQGTGQYEVKLVAKCGEVTRTWQTVVRQRALP